MICDKQDGKNSLMGAARRGRAEVVEHLVEEGARMEVVSQVSNVSSQLSV